MACCILTAYCMSWLIKTCEVLDLNIIQIQYNAFDDGTSAKPMGKQSDTLMVRLSVEGMTCTACVDTVQSAIDSLAGVSTTRVSLALCQASVIYDPASVNEADIVSTVNLSGYTAKLGQQTAREKLEVLEQTEKLKTLKQSFAESLTLATTISTLNGLESFFKNFTILTTFVVFITALWVQGSAARQLHETALSSMKMDMDLLTSISLLLGTCLGVANFYLQDLSRANSYLSSATYLATVILGGRYLRAILQQQTVKSFAQLYRLQCQAAQVEVSRLTKDGSTEQITALELEVDDQVWIQSGRIVPCDCYVVSGRSMVDQSTMTGESIPVVRQVGDFLMSGVQNLSAPLLVIISQAQEHSALEKLVQSISVASETEFERNLGSLSNKHFVKFILGLSVLSACAEFWSLSSSVSKACAVNSACERAMAILASACPCALGLASPTACYSALAAAWEKGVILTGGLPIIRKLSTLTHVIADKTGTLTTGKLQVTHVVGNLQSWHHEAICAAERAESQTHPVGGAVFQWSLLQLSESERLAQSRIRIDDMNSVPGAGVACSISFSEAEERHHLCIGTASLMRDFGIDITTNCDEDLNQQSVVYVSMDDRHLATLYVLDSARPEAAAVLRTMRDKFSLDVTMLTGDHSAEATRISSMLAIPVLSAHALPHQKQEIVHRLQNADTTNGVAMIGDGVNDIPAMAAADVGILLSPGLGKSNTACMQAADVILTSPHLGGALEALEIAKMTVQQIKFNNAWAISYNLLAVSIACGMFERYGLRIDAAMAGSIMAFSSISVIIFSLLLQRRLASINYRE